MKRLSPVWVLGPLAIAALGLAFYYPVLRLFVAGFQETPGVEAFDARFFEVFRFTYLQAFLSAVSSGVVGVPGAFLIAALGPGMRRASNALCVVAFSLPPVLVVLGLLGVGGRHGLLAKAAGVLGWEWPGIYGWVGILFAHTLFNFSLYVRLVAQALAEADPAEEKAALTLGASRLRTLRWITWPKIRGAVGSAFLLSFLFSASSFLAVLVLGGSPAFSTIEVAVYQAIKQDYDLSLAVRLASVQALIALILAWAIHHTQDAPLGRPPHALGLLYRLRDPQTRTVAWIGYGALLFVLVGLPLGWVFLKGLSSLFHSPFPWRGVFITLKLGVAAAAVSTAVAFGLEYFAHATGRRKPGVGDTLPLGSGRREKTRRRAFAVAVTLPLAVSSLLILLAWRVAWPTSTEMGWWGVALAQALVALPVVCRPLREAMARVPEVWVRQARSMGASRWQVLRWIEWPALRSAVALAFTLGALISFGEAGAVLLFLDEGTMNLTYLIFHSMSRYQFDEAYALAAWLLLMTLILAWVAGALEKEPA